MTLPPDRQLTRDEATRLGRGYVAAYNDRDLEAMLALQDENVVSHPARLFGRRPHVGHAGVRAWWKAMEASGRWYEVVVRDVRLLEPDRIVVLGDLRDDGGHLSPWGVVVRVREGLIVESRSYLSDEELLNALGVLE
jgi:ketosteroid isomerase-like protein